MVHHSPLYWWGSQYIGMRPLPWDYTVPSTKTIHIGKSSPAIHSSSMFHLPEELGGGGEEEESDCMGAHHQVYILLSQTNFCVCVLQPHQNRVWTLSLGKLRPNDKSVAAIRLLREVNYVSSYTASLQIFGHQDQSCLYLVMPLTQLLTVMPTAWSQCFYSNWSQCFYSESVLFVDEAAECVWRIWSEDETMPVCSPVIHFW